jgi:hypothetical protein
MRKAVLKWFDTGSDSISIFYKGSGHGSKASVCLTLIFMAGFIAFLILFGMLQLTTSTTIYDLANSDGYSYEIDQNELIFASKENSEPVVSLLDGDFQIVANATLTNHNCLSNLTE